MSVYTPVKLTDAESDLIEWLMHQCHFVSRSSTLRAGMLDLARRMGAPGDLMRRANLARMTARPRASRSVAARRRQGS